MRSSIAHTALAVALATLCALTTGAQEADSTDRAGRWAEVERLLSEERAAAALEIVEAIGEDARAAGDEEAWVRALYREAELRVGLHGYEEAVEVVRAAVLREGPEEPVHRVGVALLYADALVAYHRAHSWEIGQRPRIDGAADPPLARWTRERIFAEADGAFREIRSERERWQDEPVTALGDLLVERGNYPAGLRGTLRDAVVYLWAELLTDSVFWTPEESNELYRLDLGDLARGARGARHAGTDEPTAHPLARMAELLGDHEDWHLNRDNPEAAFEAAFVRLSLLRSAVREPEDQEILRAALRERLDALGGEHPIHSRGTALLATWTLERSEPGHTVAARDLALSCAVAHPESLGGRQCTALVASLEGPEYDLESMGSDGPRKRSIRVEHRNLERLWFRAYAFDLRETLERPRPEGDLHSPQEVERIVEGRPPIATWSVELPPTPDLESHATYVTPPLDRPALYLVVASAREDFRRRGNRLEAVHLVIGDLVLLTRSTGDGIEATALSGETGEPRPGTRVFLYLNHYGRESSWERGRRARATAVTGAGGHAALPLGDEESTDFLILARDGDHAAFASGWAFDRWEHEDEETEAALVYTDRSVYRPGQTVRWKVVAYGGQRREGRFTTRPDTDLAVALTDAQGDEVARREVTTNDFGTASGDFEIPAGRLLGDWSLRVERPEQGQVGWAHFAVEEYERPTFEVTLDPSGEAARLGEETELSGAVRYYFGLPVVTGRVSWRVTRQPVLTWFWPPRPSGATQTVASGRAELDAEGRFRVRFTPEADPREDSGDAEASDAFYHYRLAVDVTDEGGETRSAERVYPIGFVAVRARILADESGFFESDEPLEIAVLRSDLDGEPRAGTGTWRLVERVPNLERVRLPSEIPVEASEVDEANENAYATEGDRLRPRWEEGPLLGDEMADWREGAEVAAGTVEHGEDGRARIRAEPLPAGVYRLVYSTEDRFGRRFETRSTLIVAEDGSPGPPLSGVLLAESERVPVGGVARLLVHSGLPDQEMILEIFQDEEPIERRRLRSGDGARVVEIPVGPDLQGGFGVALTLVRDHQLVTDDVSITVPWDERRLDVEIATFRDRLRPGDREEWRVRVRGADGEALETAAAEVLASMYDRSLDLFAPHDPPDPLGLYPSRNSTPFHFTSLESEGTAWLRADGWRRVFDLPELRPDRIGLVGGHGIGGPGWRDAWAIANQSAGIITVTVESPVEEVVVTDMAAIGSSPLYQGAVPPPAAPPPPPPPARAAKVANAAGAAGREAPRTNFAETAFFEPHLRTDAEGGVTFAFTVPDSVTEWRFWAEAITRDLRSGSAERSTRSVKDLQVRPYLPRFLREGDRAEVRVVIDNSGAEAAEGRLTVELFAPDSEESVLEPFGLDPAEVASVPFEVPASDSLALTFPLTVPADAATVYGAGGLAFRATVRAGDLGDGEQRPLPILPGRVRLSQSRSATLDGAETEVLRFDELASSSDPTRESERLVVTVDGQLFQGVLGALPYLVEYPYECTEQTLNRFVSTAVVTSVLDDHPALAALAKTLAERETRTPSWDDDDPNRALALIETPWLSEARGGSVEDDDDRLLRILDPAVAKAQRDGAIARLRESHTSVGGYPWFPGGPPSPFMTLYLLQGFARAAEAGAPVPEDLRRPAWEYLHRLFLEEWLADLDDPDETGCCRESATFLAYLLSSETDGGAEVFTAEERRRLVDHAFAGWRELAPRLKLQLALTLYRAGRQDDARRVLESVMDSAITTEEQGTFWAPEPRSWVWYRDTVETHAFALRTLNEIAPDDPRRRGLAQWLFLDKRLGHWKSTRATAEAIYALAGYLESPDGESEIGVREEVAVTAGPMAERFVFQPSEVGGTGRLVIPGGEGRQGDPRFPVRDRHLVVLHRDPAQLR